MNASQTSSPINAGHKFRFGAFELDLQEGELRKHGIRIKLQQKPLQILEMLLRTPGAFVTRTELAQHLWPGLHVRFDGSLNTAVNSLRQALADSPRNPRFIETRPGRGYRFIAAVAPMEETASASSEPGAIDSIAVLPFENANDPALEHTSEGIAERLIASLSALGHLRVIARSLVSRFKGRDIEPRSAGQSLNVRAVITGRVVRREAKLMAGVELVDVASGYRLWGKEYNCAPDDTLAIEKEIAQELVKKLARPANGRADQPVAKNYAANFEAYQDYLKGRSFCNKMCEEDVRKSIAYFESALHQAPDYAPALAGLADAYNLSAFFGILTPNEAAALAREFTAKAMAMDPELVEAHTSLGCVKFLHDWDWKGAQRQFLKALDPGPNYAEAHQRYGDLLSAIGKPEQAMEQMRLAQQIEPLAPVLDMQMAWACYLARDFERAEEQSWKALAIEPRFAAAQHTLGLAYEQMGMHEEALVELENARSCSDDHPAMIAALGHAFGSAGKRDRAAEALDQIEQMSQRRYIAGYWRALLHCGLGEDDLALYWLDKAFQEHDVWLVWLLVEPRFDRLRRTARFEQLLREMALSQAG